MVVTLPSCLIQEGGRFAPIVVVPNCCPIPEGGRIAALAVVSIVQKRPIISPSKRRPLRAHSCYSQLLPNSKRRPLRGPSCCPNCQKETHYFAFKKGENPKEFLEFDLKKVLILHTKKESALHSADFKKVQNVFIFWSEKRSFLNLTSKKCSFCIQKKNQPCIQFGSQL